MFICLRGDAFITLLARTRARYMYIQAVRVASHKSNIMRSANCVTDSAGVSRYTYGFATQTRRAVLSAG